MAEGGPSEQITSYIFSYIFIISVSYCHVSFIFSRDIGGREGNSQEFKGVATTKKKTRVLCPLETNFMPPTRPTD